MYKLIPTSDLMFYGQFSCNMMDLIYLLFNGQISCYMIPLGHI